MAYKILLKREIHIVEFRAGTVSYIHKQLEELL